MSAPVSPQLARDFVTSSPEETEALAARLAGHLAPGDRLLLEGPVGAGKSHFARALIRAEQARFGLVEDIPSPTFTLVQTYWAGDLEIWHVDLYRLTDPTEVVELGLDEAMETAACLIEWPDRLGEARPVQALTLTLSQRKAQVRHIAAQATGARATELLHRLGGEA